MQPSAQALANFRKQVRAAAKALNGLCDTLRDEDAPKAGIKIVDDDPSFDFFLVDPEVLAAYAKVLK